jgi:hypothetical protein
MKPRYKFDENWSNALKLLGDNGEAEMHFRRYVEENCEPDWANMPNLAGIEAVWLLFKAEVDRRKARNSKARERRRRQREAILREKANPCKKTAKKENTTAKKSTTAKSARKAPKETEKQATESTYMAAQSAAETLKTGTVATTPAAHKQSKMSAVAGAKKHEKKSQKAVVRHSTISTSRKHAATKKQSAFAARFRGPGISAMAHQ